MKQYFLILLFCSIIGDSISQLAWNQLPNIFNGNVKTLVEYKNGSILAGTTGGIFYSSDSGSNWQPTDLQEQTITQIEYFIDSTIFAINEEGVLYQSKNGFNWEILTSNLPNIAVKQIEAEETGNLFALLKNDSIYFSTDKGTTWNVAMGGLQNIKPQWIITTNVGRVYAATSFGVFASNDNGQRWNSASSNLPFRETSYIHYNQYVGMLYAYSNATQQLCVRQEILSTWQLADSIPNFVSIYNDKLGNTYALTSTKKIYISSNGGFWSEFNFAYQFVEIQTILVLDTNKILLGTEKDGVNLYYFSGGYIYPQNQRLTNANITSIAIQDSLTMYTISNENHLIKTIDGGQNWETIYPTFYPNIQLFQTVITSNKRLYLTTSKPNTLSRSDNEGFIWESVQTFISINQILHNPQTQTLFFVNQNDSIYQASDSIINFVPINFLPINANLPSGKRTLHLTQQNQLLTTSNLGVYTLIDSTKIWRAFGNNQPNDAPIALASNKYTTATASESKAYILIDNSWTPIYQTINKITSIAIDDSGTVFIAIAKNGIYYSKPPYTNWLNNNINLPPTIIINQLIFNDKHQLLAATATKGIFQSEPVYKLYINQESNRSTIPTIKIYPNPFDNQLNIKLNPQPEPLHLEIYNAVGQLLTNHILPPNSSEYTISTNKFPTSLYLLKILQSNRLIKHFKLIKS